MDGGAATASLAGFLALAPIHERGTFVEVRVPVGVPLYAGDTTAVKVTFCAEAAGLSDDVRSEKEAKKGTMSNAIKISRRLLWRLEFC